MHRFFILLLIGLSILSGCTPPAPALENHYDIIPLPQSMVAGEGQFIIDENTTLVTTEANEEVQKILKDFSEGLRSVCGNDLAIENTASGKHLLFELNEDIAHKEAYVLTVTPEQVSVQAVSAQGLFYAVQTLKQLLSNDEASQSCYLPVVSIEDQPRFTYRGMHLDVARHFHPVETVKKMIDQLAFHKMNTFHWHLTEDQGWRIEIKQYPKLTTVGAYRNGTLIGHYNDQPHQFDGVRYGGFYTQEQIKEVIQYAQERYVDIIPEIELPGHAQAALAAYPELGCKDGPYEVLQKWGVSENVFCPTEATFTFLENVLDEVIDLFPGKYIHIGGDECPKTQWKESAFCQQLMQEEGLKDEYELQSYFIRRIEKYINSRGKQIIGWDEILEGGLAPNATIMSWRGIEGGIEAAKAGHDVIMTPTSHCYFDYYQSDHPDEPLAIGGLLPLEKVYNYEPIPDELAAEEAKYILGTQANVWTEYIPTEEKLEYMLFPRLSALAEVAWSSQDRDFPYFVQRLIPHMKRLSDMGISSANHLYDINASISNNSGKVQLELSKLAEDATIYYTIDGREPSITDQRYDQPIQVSATTTIKAQSFRNDKKIGREWAQVINWHLAAGQQLELGNHPHPKYSGGGPLSIINGVEGSNERYGDAEWLGFDGKDFNATIDLGESKLVQSVNFRFFKGEGQWLYLPKKITVSISEDGETFTLAGQQGQLEGNTKVVSTSIAFAPVSARYLKIEAQNYGVIPEGKQGAGNMAWLFVDEISVD